MGVFETLQARGFYKQCTDEEKVRELLNNESLTLYVGADPTGKSLHIGHMVPFFAMHHLQKAGHTIIAVVGGGTALLGDPSGKTEMRKILSKEEIFANADAIEKQLGTVIDIDAPSCKVVNNYDWLGDLNYIDFIRDIGQYFSVNRMLSFEAYKQRLERGLSFLEFNYQLLQSYDFMMLNQKYGCTLQIGGDDQWGNIVAGVDLIRRTGGTESYGLTFPLVTRSDGKKMGKSEKGAIFLDPDLCAPYDFFQYWRNVADADVVPFLKMFTFLELDEIAQYEGLEGQELNPAKERLAYEQTKIIHGQEEADKALAAAKAAFTSGGGAMDKDAIPSATIERGSLEVGVGIIDLFSMTDLCASRAEARRLIQQGGARVNDVQITDIEAVLTDADLQDGEFLLRAGKKRYHRVVAS